jgi:hypothetical protein
MTCCDGFGYVLAYRKGRTDGIPHAFRCTKCNNPRVSSFTPAWNEGRLKDFSLTQLFEVKSEPAPAPSVPTQPTKEPEQLPKDRRTLSAADFDDSDEYPGRGDEDL